MAVYEHPLIPKSPVRTLECPCVVDSLNMIYKAVYEHEKGDFTYDFDIFLPTYGRNLQRPLVWSDRQKQQFICTLMRNETILPLYITIDYDNEIIEVIDGKQRLTTALSFMHNDFAVRLTDGKSYFYRDLPTQIQDRLGFMSFSAYQHIIRKGIEETHVSEDQKVAWYLFINNSGTPQQAEYLNELDDLINNEK